jgi:hypothetical protein
VTNGEIVDKNKNIFSQGTFSSSSNLGTGMLRFDDYEPFSAWFEMKCVGKGFNEKQGKISKTMTGSGTSASVECLGDKNGVNNGQ